MASRGSQISSASHDARTGKIQVNDLNIDEVSKMAWLRLTFTGVADAILKK